MAQIINTNIASLNAQRNLNESQSSLNTSLERLSTGLRINSAKDDAAGLAISERFTSQIRGLDQAVRNANDGISFAQTAEGALGTVGDALQRIRELSVQAANDSNSASDREALNDEVQQLVEEVGRIANATEFNGQKVLDGSLDDLFFQVGANQGQNIAVSGVDTRSSQLGASELASATPLSQEEQVEDLTFAGDLSISVNGTDNAVDVDLTGATSLEDAVREINSTIAEAAASDQDVADAGLSASLRVDNNGETSVVLNGAFDADFEIDGDTNGDTGSFTYTDAAGATQAGNDLFTAGNTGANVNLTEIGVASREDASQTIGIIDGALSQVNGLRAELGSVQVRFESTIDNLSISSENLSASRSRIQDADFAAETANLTKGQILQQAGTSILAQANSLPQNVLSLLG
jgi:flagellin